MMPEVRLRPARRDDAPRLLAWRNDPVARRFSFTGDPVTEAEHERWIERRLADQGTRLWIAEVAQRPVGQVRADRLDGGAAELHIAVDPGERGQGHGPAMLRAAASAAAPQLGIRRVVGRLMAANSASRRAFEKAGFVADDPTADPLRFTLDLVPAPVVAIVQARMGSTRLPGKVLAEVAGRPLLGHMIDRVRAARTLDAVCVATSDDPRDDVVADLAAELGVEVFRGSEHDVLGRFVGAAAHTDAGTVVRLTADCPLMAPEVIDRVVGALGASGADFATNAMPSGRTYPDGMDVEVFTRAALERIDAGAASAPEREHVTLRFHCGEYRVEPVHLDPPRGDVRITVDTAPDLERVRAVFEALLPSRPDFALADVLAAIDATSA